MKFFLSILLIAVISFIASSFITPKTTDVAESLKSKKDVIVEEDVAAAAVYCSVTVNGNSASCWFCNCAGLLESMPKRTSQIQKVKVLLK